MRYLPGIIWNSRASGGQRFKDDDPWPGMRRELGARPLFWALLVPLGRFPRFAAMPFFQAWRVINRIGRELDKLSAKRRGIGQVNR